MTSLDQASIVDLSARFSGVLLRPDQSGYDEVRRVHNGMIDRRPALIAGCLGNADIVDAINFARTHGLDLPCAAAVITLPAGPSATMG